MTTENQMGCLQADGVERKIYARVPGTGSPDDRERNSASDLMERIPDRDKWNSAYKQVRRSHGVPGIDGKIIEATLPWLKEHKEELLQQLRGGKYKGSSARRKEIPKPGVRQLGMSTVIDQVIQQDIIQVLKSIYDPLFSIPIYTETHSPPRS